MRKKVTINFHFKFDYVRGGRLFLNKLAGVIERRKTIFITFFNTSDGITMRCRGVPYATRKDFITFVDGAVSMNEDDIVITRVEELDDYQGIDVGVQ